MAVASADLSLKKKVNRLAKLTTMLTYDRMAYYLELLAFGDTINQFKKARRYILGNIITNADKLTGSEAELLQDWLSCLTRLSPLESQVVQELRETCSMISPSPGHSDCQDHDPLALAPCWL